MDPAQGAGLVHKGHNTGWLQGLMRQGRKRMEGAQKIKWKMPAFLRPQDRSELQMEARFEQRREQPDVNQAMGRLNVD